MSANFLNEWKLVEIIKIHTWAIVLSLTLAVIKK